MIVRATFVMEQHIGHYTYYQNLRRSVEQDDRVQARWVPVTYTGSAGLLERLPGLPSGVRGTLNGRSEVRRGLLNGEADVLFFNTQVPAVLGGDLTRRRPYVIATDLTPVQYDRLGTLYGHSPDRPGLLSAYKHRVNRALFCGAAQVLPWSNWAGTSLIDDYGVDPQRVTVIPPGVDLHRWTPGNRQAGGPVRLLFVGGDLERKGGAVLLEAYRALPRGLAELHLVTRTPVAPEEGVIVYHNMQPNTPALLALYQNSDVFVLPTQAEAFGIAAVEATATGLPVVATRVGGLADIVAEGETGLLVPPGDGPALARALRQLVESPGLCRKMGHAARRRAEHSFDAQRNAARVIACLVAAAYRRSEVEYVV